MEWKRIYVFHNPITGYTKVGVSNDINQRVKALEGASGCKLDVLFASEPVPFARPLEQMVHRDFAYCRMQGEWFNEDKARISDNVRHACEDNYQSVTDEENDHADRRVTLYRKGWSVSKIAHEEKVSRQAIIKSLKRAGVHSPPEKIVKSKPKTMSEKYMPIDLDKIPELSEAKKRRGSSREKRIGRNLYITNDGFLVKYFHDGCVHEEKFRTREDLMDAYE